MGMNVIVLIHDLLALEVTLRESEIFWYVSGALSYPMDIWILFDFLERFLELFEKQIGFVFNNQI